MNKEQLLAQAFALCDEIEQRQSRLREILSQLGAVEPAHNAEMPHYIPEYAPVTAAQPTQQAADESAPPEIITETTLPQHKADLRKSLTINDRFRFRRELFAGDEHAMNSLLDRLSDCASADEACATVATLGWDVDSDVVNEFVEFVRNNFNAHRS